jgi:hypothetical protein
MKLFKFWIKSIWTSLHKWHWSCMYECHLGMDESRMIIMDESHSSTFIHANIHLQYIHEEYTWFVHVNFHNLQHLILRKHLKHVNVCSKFEPYVWKEPTDIWKKEQTQNPLNKQENTSNKKNSLFGSTASLLNLRKLDKCFSLLHKN